MKRYHALLLLIGLLALVFVGMLDADSQREDDALYCEMVGIWRANAGAPESDRPGWPPYRNDITCEE